MFRFDPESALLDHIEMISFDGADSGTNSYVLVSFLLDVGTFVERLFLYCFNITTAFVWLLNIVLHVTQSNTFQQKQGVTERCRLSWLINSALVSVAGSHPMSTAVHIEPK